MNYVQKQSGNAESVSRLLLLFIPCNNYEADSIKLFDIAILIYAGCCVIFILRKSMREFKTDYF